TITSTAGKYAILLQKCTNFLSNDIYFNNVASDGVHVQGPSSFGKITNIYGLTVGDDVVALTPNDWTQYAVGSGGNITDIVIDTVVVEQQAIATAVKVLGG